MSKPAGAPAGDPQSETSQAARRLGRLGAQKGGRARARSLTPAERSEIARHAVRARWAKSGRTSPKADPQPQVEDHRSGPDPVSMFHGPLAIGRATARCHVLSNGWRALTEEDVAMAFTGSSAPDGLDRLLRRVATDHEALMSRYRVRFRVRGSPVPASGFGAGVIIEICDAILSARVDDRLKKKHLELGCTAESIVRSCARSGITALIDEACGYDKVRSMQLLQLELQAFVADSAERWALLFPAEFWKQLARLRGRTGPPQPLPMSWSPYVLAFVYDALDTEVHRELRRHDPDPRFTGDRSRWLDAVGPGRIADRVETQIAVMKTCTDMDEFDSVFANVLLKRPLDIQLLAEPT